jgi:hypothetical protein
MPKAPRVGPSWTEVFLGAFLSLALGVVLGAASLIFKPVIVAKELPKEADRLAGATYYLEGTRDTNKGRLAETKRKGFAAGESVAVTEDDLNVLATPKPVKTAPPPPAPKGKAGEPAPAPPPEAKILPPNFRIRENVMQIAVPIKLGAFGLGADVFFISRGDFTRKDGHFVFVPASMTLGSCPLDRLPFVNSFIFSKLLGAQPIPEDIAASWAKLIGVHVDGSELKLTMP